MLNPSSLVTNGAIVGPGNPLPTVEVPPGVGGPDVALNPRSLVLDPLPIYSAVDADALAWRDVVIANGGTVSVPRLVIVSDFIEAEKAAGIWALTDDYVGLWGENAVQALTSLKQRRLGVAQLAPAFVANMGYTFDGATNYIDSGFNPRTHGANLPTSGHICVYCRTNITAGFDVGASSAAAVNATIRSRSGSSVTGSWNSATAGGVASPSALGLHAINRSGTTFTAYRNGASLGTYGPSTGAADLVSLPLFVGCLNNAGTPGTFTSRSIGFWAVGVNMDATQNLARYTNVQAWATAIGAQV